MAQAAVCSIVGPKRREASMTVLWTAISVAVVAGGLVLALYVLVRWFGAAHRL